MSQNKFNYIIIENEKLGYGIVKNFFDGISNFTFKGRFDNAFDALPMFKSEEIHLVFINLSDNNNAIQFIKSVNRDLFPLFVVMSHNKDYALEAVRVINMIDFIVKPVMTSRLNDTLKIFEHAVKLRMPQVVSKMKKSMFIKVDKKKIKINLDDIYYLESVKDYVKVVTKTNRYLVYKTLTAFTQELDPENFMRVHRSYTVALDKVDAIDGFYIEINGTKVPFSRRYNDELRDKLSIGE